MTPICGFESIKNTADIKGFIFMQARPNKMRATAVVLAYNQSRFVEEAVNSVLNQNFDGLEVILSDDGSSDDTFEIMSKITSSYNGPHTIRLNKNKKNLGFIAHINLVFKLATTQFIIYNPGDDMSLPNRFQKLWVEYKRTNALLVHSDVIEVMESGQEVGIKSQKDVLRDISLFRTSKKMSLCIGASCGWDRDLIKIFGEISETDTYDDVVFYFRAKLAGDRIGYVQEPLIRYRTGSGITNTPVKNYSEKLDDLKKKTSVAVATLRQRLKDCQNFSPHLVYLKRYIKFWIKVAQGRGQAYAGEKTMNVIKTFSLPTILGYAIGRHHFRRARRKYKN